MWEVSQAYRNQMKRPDIERYISGTAGDTDFTANDIIKGSLHVSNQCAESGELKIGSVYTAMMECTFRRGLVERETWKGLQVELSEGVYLREINTIETIPIGVFNVDEAVHGENGVSIKAYDNMLKFEKKLSLDTTYGTPYELASIACGECGVELATTREEMEDFPNGKETLTLYADNDLETWRDLLFWIGQTCAAFWTINRVGKLEMRRFGMVEVNEIPSNLRNKSASFSDFTTGYTAITCEVKETGKNEYFQIVPDDKLTYNLGQNPFMQYDNKSSREKKCRNILDSISQIKYVPFSAWVLYGSVYDLGDVIRFTGGRADENKLCCVMSWDYDGKGFALEGYGSDPATAGARSKTDKELKGIENSINSQEMIFYSFTNSQPITINDGDSAIISNLRYSALVNTKVVFALEALLGIDTTVDGINFTDAEGKIIYELNDSQIEEYKPMETWMDGDHILHLRYVLDLNTKIMQHLVVKLKMLGGSAEIGVGCIKATIQGQGLAATDTWDGTFDVSDRLDMVDITATPSGIKVPSITDRFTITLQTPTILTQDDILLDDEICMPIKVETTPLTDEASVETEEK